MTIVGDHDHRFCLSLATLVMSEQLTDAEPNEQRRQRKRTVAQRKWEALRRTFPDDLGELLGYGGTGPALRQLTHVLAQRAAGWSPVQRGLLLVDLVMSDVFAPYELKVPTNDFADAVRNVAAALELPDESEALLAAWNDVLRAHRPRRWRTVIAPSTMNASTLTTSGPDPAVATALAAAAGLTGASADAQGVALLAGGSLSIGGSALAGGLWLVIAPPDGGPLPSGGHGLLLLGPAQARVELIKLQLSAWLVVHCGLADGPTTADVIDGLASVGDDLATQLDVERRVNDDDASRITGIEGMMHAVDDVRRQIGHVETQVA
jgi:hypothetical protein